MISEDDAVKIARQLASDNAWAWGAPTEVIIRKSWFGKPWCYEVYSHANKPGSKVKVLIDANTGKV